MFSLGMVISQGLGLQNAPPGLFLIAVRNQAAALSFRGRGILSRRGAAASSGITRGYRNSDRSLRRFGCCGAKWQENDNAKKRDVFGNIFVDAGMCNLVKTYLVNLGGFVSIFRILAFRHVIVPIVYGWSL